MSRKSIRLKFSITLPRRGIYPTFAQTPGSQMNPCERNTSWGAVCMVENPSPHYIVGCAILDCVRCASGLRTGGFSPDKFAGAFAGVSCFGRHFAGTQSHSGSILESHFCQHFCQHNGVRLQICLARREIPQHLDERVGQRVQIDMEFSVCSCVSMRFVAVTRCTYSQHRS